MKFEFYVLNYNINARKVENFNIFNNIHVKERTEQEVKKYLRAPNKYEYKCNIFEKDNETIIYGFEGFCRKLKMIIMCEENSRREYEISVGDAFEMDCNKLEKWDCYKQAIPNIEIIAREVIYQYKEQTRKSK